VKQTKITEGGRGGEKVKNYWVDKEQFKTK